MENRKLFFVVEDGYIVETGVIYLHKLRIIEWVIAF